MSEKLDRLNKLSELLELRNRARAHEECLTSQIKKIRTEINDNRKIAVIEARNKELVQKVEELKSDIGKYREITAAALRNSGETWKEIGDELGISGSSARTMVHRFARHLRSWKIKEENK